MLSRRRFRPLADAFRLFAGGIVFLADGFKFPCWPFHISRGHANGFVLPCSAYCLWSLSTVLCCSADGSCYRADGFMLPSWRFHVSCCSALRTKVSSCLIIRMMRSLCCHSYTGTQLACICLLLLTSSPPSEVLRSCGLPTVSGCLADRFMYLYILL